MFGIRLKELRKLKGVTQEQLAAIIGVERSSIGKYEGKSKIIPSDDIKGKIASYFGVSVDYLLGRTDDATPPPADARLSDIDFALSGEIRELTDAEKQDLLDYVRFKRSQRGRK